MGSSSVPLSEIDRGLLERCLLHKPRAWEDFVDRFMGLVIHVVNHTAHARSLRLTPADRDDLCAEVFLHVVKDDYLLLRHFRGQSSLATYLTVVARRIVVRKLLAMKTATRLGDGLAAHAAVDLTPAPEERLGNIEQVERLLQGLDATEARIVRMYHLEGISYHEISSAVGVPENSIGPILSRARSKMREQGAHSATN
jgi:RNA polymerase sigma-70 factor, ECF subfamily